jgi:hypothetical protein
MHYISHVTCRVSIFFFFFSLLFCPFFEENLHSLILLVADVELENGDEDAVCEKLALAGIYGTVKLDMQILLYITTARYLKCTW